MAATIIQQQSNEAAPLTQRRILHLYYPLAISWLFMSLDGPMSVAVLNHLPNKTVNTAAFSAFMAIAFWIESPIIDLLSTSTTLSTTRANRLLLRKFALILMAWVTIGHVLVLEPHVYAFIARTLSNLPAPVADAALVGLMFMVPWSAVIGWRRYLQGILIRLGKTRAIGLGTGLRVATMVLVAVVLAVVTKMAGTAIIAISLVASVAAESAFTHFVADRALREMEVGSFATEDMHVRPTITMRQLAAFHIPLTLTTIAMISGFPIINAFISRTDHPTLALAAWSVAGTLIFLSRSIAFALPETVISLHKNAQTAGQLRRFCFAVGCTISLTMGLAALFRVDYWVFRNVLSAAPETSEMAHIAFCFAVFMPFLNCVQSYLRGMLTAYHQTPARLGSTIGGLTVMIATLVVGLGLGWPGVMFASAAMTVGLVMELLVLFWFWKRHSKKIDWATD